MNSQSSLQDIFNAVIMSEETLNILDMDKKAYDSLRVMLSRKFKVYKNQCQDIGMETYDDKFLQCTYDAEKRSGCFRLATSAQHRRKMYTVAGI